MVFSCTVRGISTPASRAGNTQMEYLQIGPISCVLVTVSGSASGEIRGDRLSSAPLTGIVRPANPGLCCSGGMILGIQNAVRRARWNQIKTKLHSVLLWAHNPPLSMNSDQYKGNKRRNRGREREKGRYTVSLSPGPPVGCLVAERRAPPLSTGHSYGHTVCANLCRFTSWFLFLDVQNAN